MVLVYLCAWYRYKECFTYSEITKPQQAFAINYSCHVSAFGKKEGFKTPKNDSMLREANVSVLKGKDCQERLRSSILGRYYMLNKESVLCAGGDNVTASCELVVVSSGII
jgi:hypothetical protein